MLENPIHEAFAQHYAETGNATASAKYAGLYAHPAARGCDLLKRADVAARVQELSGTDMTTRLAHKVGVTELQRLQDAVTHLLSLTGK